MSIFTAFDITASSLYAQRIHMNIIANNLANVNSTRDAWGRINPYRRKVPVFAPRPPVDGNPLQGVKVVGIVPDMSDFRRVYNPGHPDADKDGYVLMPNVNPIVEMVDMISAARTYEANVTAWETTKSMFAAALRLLG